jgi:hypothetical protein
MEQHTESIFKAKYVGSEIGLVIKGYYKEGGHETQGEWVKERNLVQASRKKRTRNSPYEGHTGLSSMREVE